MPRNDLTSKSIPTLAAMAGELSEKLMEARFDEPRAFPIRQRLETVERILAAKKAAVAELAVLKPQQAEKRKRTLPPNLKALNEARQLSAVPAKVLAMAYGDIQSAYTRVKGLLPTAVSQAEAFDAFDTRAMFAPLHEAVARCEADVTKALDAIYTHVGAQMLSGQDGYPESEG